MSTTHRDFKDFIQDKFGTTIEFARRINMSRQQAAVYVDEPGRMKVDLLVKIAQETQTPICYLSEIVTQDEL